MSKRGNGYGSENRVNILKKVKVGKNGTSTPPSSNLTVNSVTRFVCAAKSSFIPRDTTTSSGGRTEESASRLRIAQKSDLARRKALELEANRAGIETVQEIGSGKGPTVVEAVASYLKDMELPQRSQRPMLLTNTVWLFASTCAKRFVQNVKREDLLSFIRKFLASGCGPRTAYNRAVIVSQLLKTNGITKLLHNRDWPEYVEPIRPMYEGEEIGPGALQSSAMQMSVFCISAIC